MSVTHSPKGEGINKMTCYLYTRGLLFGTNIIIASILFYLNLCNPPTPEVPNLDFLTKYNLLHDTT